MPISINKKLGLAINPNKENLDNWDRLIKISHKNPNNLSARNNKLYAKLGKINKKQTPIKINGKIIKAYQWHCNKVWDYRDKSILPEKI